MYSEKLAEEPLKVSVAKDFFKDFNYEVLGKVDFAISQKGIFHTYYLFAEAKKGRNKDIIESFIQLILTIGKEKRYLQTEIPLFLGAFDCEKIAFIPYINIESIFLQNDFNWHTTPSDHSSNEFKQLYALLKDQLESSKYQFYFSKDSKELNEFIKNNFYIENPHIKKLQINQTNFTSIYQKWLIAVKPSIAISNQAWASYKAYTLLDADFFLADLIAEDNNTISLSDKMKVLLKQNSYEIKSDLKEKILNSQLTFDIGFKDNQISHNSFWNLYERPPKEEYWEHIYNRRDLLVQKDIRERKGAFFTPQIWARKALEYLRDTLGESWQDEYYIWDCAAGTGNLLVNLTEPSRIYASTLDSGDVGIMQELRERGTLPLLEENIFQFDFLNDDFFNKPCARHKKYLKECQNCVESKLPPSLQEILSDEKKRKKLVIFINPPYAEAASATQVTRSGANKTGVSLDNAVYYKYSASLGKASNELFAQFFFRIYKEIPDCKLAAFSTLKYVNSSNFIKFRETFKAKFLKGFMIPAYTFDNVKGQFPIGFLIWDLSKKE